MRNSPAAATMYAPFFRQGRIAPWVLALVCFLAPMIGASAGVAPGETPAACIVPQPDRPAPTGVGEAMRPPPGTVALSSGAGFFAAADGSVITAAHVVQGCRTIRLVSRHLAPVAARLVASDSGNDIALLMADGVRVPAHLAIAPARPGMQHVLVLGFPAGARADVPDETWASVVNDRLRHTAALETDRRALLWLQNREIAQGYSGGPIVDPFSGHVVGIVRALIDAQRGARAYGIATPDLSIGPGAAPLRAMLARTTAGDDGPPQGDLFDQARRATVHVLCWQ